MSSSNALDPSKSCKDQFDCEEPVYQNTRYCVLHLPSANKTVDFEEALEKRLQEQNFDFRGVWFPANQSFHDFSFTTETNFQDTTFNGGADFLFARFEKPVSFNNAKFFERVYFGARFMEQVDFSRTTFIEYADFTRASFEKESNFFSTTFNARAKFEDATFGLATTFEDASFRGTVNFHSTTFGGTVNFRSVICDENVTFDLATFAGEASFHNTKFKKRVDFETTFNGTVQFFETEFLGRAELTRVVFEKDVNFFGANFSSISSFDDAAFKQRTNFDQVRFKERVSFNSTSFKESAQFRGVTFEDRVTFDDVTFAGEANFHLANFKDYVRFRGTQVFCLESPPKFREVKFNNPRLVSFHSVTLRPFWFVEVNARDFAFTNVKWSFGNLKGKAARITIDNEIAGITSHYQTPPSEQEAHELMSIACWNLAVNAEENHRYVEASDFRSLAMESRRLAIIRKADATVSDANGKRRLKEIGSRVRSYGGSRLTLPGVYRFVSGYGENITRALTVLVGIWLLFAVLYALILSDSHGLLGWRGFAYSAAVLTLQRPDPRPDTLFTQILVTAEAILGPVQAALLALAIRRKFMR